MQEAKKILILILRWLFFIPAGILAAFAGYWFMYIVAGFTPTEYAWGRFSIYIVKLLAIGAGSYYFIISGVYVAPTQKKKTIKFIMAGLAICLIGWSTYIAIIDNQFYGIFPYLQVFAALVGVLFSFVFDESS
jgi:uncharacterized membrane protein